MIERKYITKEEATKIWPERIDMNWIKCSDLLPTTYRVLMTYNNFVMEGEFSNGKFYPPSGCSHTPGYCKCEEQEGITHWMPLPEQPKD